MIRHKIHYERFSPNLNKQVQGITILDRDKSLTIAGAQRILRSRKVLSGYDRQGWETAVVLSIETQETV